MAQSQRLRRPVAVVSSPSPRGVHNSLRAAASLSADGSTPWPPARRKWWRLAQVGGLDATDLVLRPWLKGRRVGRSDRKKDSGRTGLDRRPAPDELQHTLAAAISGAGPAMLPPGIDVGDLPGWQRRMIWFLFQRF